MVMLETTMGSGSGSAAAASCVAVLPARPARPYIASVESKRA
jgi:hypothetical protein